MMKNLTINDSSDSFSLDDRLSNMTIGDTAQTSSYAVEKKLRRKAISKDHFRRNRREETVNMMMNLTINDSSDSFSLDDRLSNMTIRDTAQTSSSAVEKKLRRKAISKDHFRRNRREETVNMMMNMTINDSSDSFSLEDRLSNMTIGYTAQTSSSAVEERRRMTTISEEHLRRNRRDETVNMMRNLTINDSIY